MRRTHECFPRDACRYAGNLIQWSKSSRRFRSSRYVGTYRIGRTVRAPEGASLKGLPVWRLGMAEHRRSPKWDLEKIGNLLPGIIGAVARLIDAISRLR
jgi:hypothetical protein